MVGVGGEVEGEGKGEEGGKSGREGENFGGKFSVLMGGAETKILWSRGVRL